LRPPTALNRGVPPPSPLRGQPPEEGGCLPLPRSAV